MTAMTWRPQGQHGVETMETTETTAMETTWGPSGGYGDNVGMTGMTWGRCGDDRDDMGTTWGPRGQHGVETTETMETTAMETTWGPSGGYGDDVGTMGTTWGQCGDHGDNEITKNAITFERLEIIEFHLKIWDP